MKLQAFFGAVSAAVFAATSSALILVDELPSTVQNGNTYEVAFQSDHDYSIECLLTRKEDYGWDTVMTLFDKEVFRSGSNAFNWTVSLDYVKASAEYGVWISGSNIPDASTGYANSTNWFKITPPPGRPLACWGWKVESVIHWIGICVLVSVALIFATRLVRKTRQRKEMRREALSRPEMDQKMPLMSSV